jgi:hypothetical protein
MPNSWLYKTVKRLENEKYTVCEALDKNTVLIKVPSKILEKLFE